MSKLLTREMLNNWGIEVEIDSTSKFGYKIYRTWHKTMKGSKIERKEVIVRELVCKHKYSKDVVYPGILFSANCKTYSYALSRLVYAYFNGEVPEGYEVDHIDNDKFNNSLDNLQLLTKQENLKKRYADNNFTKCPNQFTYKGV